MEWINLAFFTSLLFYFLASSISEHVKPVASTLFIHLWLLCLASCSELLKAWSNLLDYPLVMRLSLPSYTSPSHANCLTEAAWWYQIHDILHYLI